MRAHTNNMIHFTRDLTAINFLIFLFFQTHVGRQFVQVACGVSPWPPVWCISVHVQLHATTATCRLLCTQVRSTCIRHMTREITLQYSDQSSTKEATKRGIGSYLKAQSGSLLPEEGKSLSLQVYCVGFTFKTWKKFWVSTATKRPKMI